MSRLRLWTPSVSVNESGKGSAYAQALDAPAEMSEGQQSAAVICLTGPTGVGKTDTAWALLQISAPMVLLDSDWFAARSGFSWQSQQDVESVFQALSTQLRFHLDRGRDRFVVPMPLEMALAFEERRHLLEQGCPIACVQLRCTAEILRGRINARDRHEAQRDAELAASDSQIEQFRQLESTIVAIDNSELDELHTAQAVWAITLASTRSRR